MKQSYLKSLNFRLTIYSVILLGLAFIIHSCKKDNSKAQATITNAAVSAAKAWYESTYPVNANGGKLATQGVNSQNGNGAFDYSQAIKPDWGHASTYTRLGRNVIEMPIDPSGSIYSALAGSATGPGMYPKENSRSSFILLSNGKGYDAYIMTILADPSYLKNDHSKLAKNTYRKYDPDFTGYVFYFTPKGQYSGGYEFKNGQLLTPVAQNKPSDGKVIQSAGASNLKIAVGEPPSYDCTFYYMLTIDQYGNVIDQTFLYAECTPNPGTDPGSPGAGSPGGNPPVPPKCNPPAGSGGEESVQSLIINVTEPPPGGDGGMPPPTTVPCNVTVPKTVINVDSTFKAVLCGGLKSSEVASIQSTINAFENLNCASKFLTNYFGNQTFSFCIDSLSQNGNGGNVNYNPVNNSFTFTTDYAATPVFADLLEHEFFHLYQNAIYPGGTAKYAKSTAVGASNPAGFVNIEFEEAVFLDIATNSRQAFASGTSDQKKAYDTWINQLTDNDTIYPNLNSSSTAYSQFISSYNSFLSQYNNLPDNPNASPIVSLTPQAFLDIFQTVTPNC